MSRARMTGLVYFIMVISLQLTTASTAYASGMDGVVYFIASIVIYAFSMTVIVAIITSAIIYIVFSRELKSRGILGRSSEAAESDIITEPIGYIKVQTRILKWSSIFILIAVISVYLLFVFPEYPLDVIVPSLLIPIFFLTPLLLVLFILIKPASKKINNLIASKERNENKYKFALIIIMICNIFFQLIVWALVMLAFSMRLGISWW